MKKLLNLLLSFVPCRTSRAVDSAWCNGFLAGIRSAGITRDSRGRFKSLTNPPKKKRSSTHELFAK